MNPAGAAGPPRRGPPDSHPDERDATPMKQLTPTSRTLFFIGLPPPRGDPPDQRPDGKGATRPPQFSTVQRPPFFIGSGAIRHIARTDLEVRLRNAQRLVDVVDLAQHLVIEVALVVLHDFGDERRADRLAVLVELHIA